MVTRLAYTLDCCDPESLAAFWSEALGYSLRGRFGDYWVLVPPDSVAEPWFVLQRVGEEGSGKNRMHVDIHADDLDERAERLEALGARRLSEVPVSQHTASWYVMADPEGNEFCIVRPGG